MTALLLVGGCAAVPAAPPAPPPAQCGGEPIDRAAPVVVGGDVMIAAPPEAVWAVHTDVDGWPSWKRDVPAAVLLDPGPLRVGSRFQWSHGALAITSTVRAAEPDRCTLWTGPANGIDGTHLWVFTPVPGGTLVHTEESWSGRAVEQDVPAARAMLDAGLTSGRNDLKSAVESRCRCAPTR